MKKTVTKEDITIIVEVDKNGFVVPNSIMEVNYPGIIEKHKRVPVKAGETRPITINDQFEAVLAFRKISDIFSRYRIGNRIKELREQQNLTQSDLAEKTGLKQANIARIESGKYSTGQDILSTIAAALGKHLDII